MMIKIGYDLSVNPGNHKNQRSNYLNGDYG